MCIRDRSNDVKKTLSSAIANAENNFQYDIDNLYVSEAYVGKSIVLKRFRARAKGRASGIKKPYSNLTIILSEKKLDKKKYSNIELHLVGPLQSNKVKDAVSIFDFIQTVDREKIAKSLKKEEINLKKKISYMIQINTGKETQKSGVMPDDADDFFKYCKEDLKLNIQGLMCIPPYDDDPSLHFDYLRKKNLKYKLPYLSMGMSEDYEKAIILGATHLRIGTAIFGNRPKK